MRPVAGLALFLVAGVGRAGDESCASWVDDSVCNIARIDLSGVRPPPNVFDVIDGRTPVVLDFGADHNDRFRSLVERDALLGGPLSEIPVRLSSSNSYSHGSLLSTLGEYVGEIMPEQARGTRSNETFYLFGDFHRAEAWEPLLREYEEPPSPCAGEAALSFGVGGVGSGVSFHFHALGFSEVFQGRKRWFLYEHLPPLFDPDEPVKEWASTKYHQLSAEEKPLECTLRAGQALYFPSSWYHATLNLDAYTTFVSAFLPDDGCIRPLDAPRR